MLAAAFVILLAPQQPLDALVEHLGHRDVRVREATAHRLLAGGEPVADYLESRTYAEPEVRRQVLRILYVLRAPRLEIHAPEVICQTEPRLDLRIVLTNPGPRDRKVMNFWEPRRHMIKKRVITFLGRSPHWSIATGLKPGVVIKPHKVAVVPAWTLAPKTSVEFSVRLKLARPKEGKYTLALHYRAQKTVFSGRTTVHVVDDRDLKLSQLVASPDAAKRKLALGVLARRARESSPNTLVEQALRRALQSPEQATRIEAVRLMGRSGQGRHAGPLIARAGRVAPEVNEAILPALLRLYPKMREASAFERLVTRSMGSGNPWTPAQVDRSITVLKGAMRTRFLAALLRQSRSAKVHAHVVRLLAADGITVSIHPVSGRVYPSTIHRLSRAK